MSHYHYLSEIGNNYNNEEGGKKHREEFLDSIASRYRSATNSVKAAMAAVAAPADFRVENEVPGKPGQMRVSVRAQAKKFEQLGSAEDAAKLALGKAKENLWRQERFLKRMGATLIDDPANPKFGYVDWGFTTQTVVYDRLLEAQGSTRLRIHGGRLYTDDAFRQPFDTRLLVTANMGPGYAIYVMSETGNIHVSSHSVGHRHHSSLLAGGNVAGAGEMKVLNGVLKWISNKSGHYFPEVAHLLQTIDSLTRKGVPLNAVSLSFLSQGGPPRGTPFATVDAFLATQLNATEDIAYHKLLRYLEVIPYATFGAMAAAQGWFWVSQAQFVGGARGVITGAGAAVPHDDVRRWLKAQGHQRAQVLTPNVKSGYGR